MKILMYIPQPGPTRAPEVTANLARLGNEVIAISPPEKQMLELGVNIKPIRFTTLPFVGPLLLIGYGLGLAIVTIARWKPDAIYTLGGSMASGLLLAKLFKCPLVTEVNGLGRAELKLIPKGSLSMLISRISRWMDEREITYSDHVIVVTASLKEALQRYLNIQPKKITVITNGANTHFFKPINGAKESLRLDSSCYYVGFVGIFAPWQGLDYMIKSASLILKEVPDTKFLLVGDGMTKRGMVELTEELHLAENFIFVGAVPYTEVPKYINAMDVCISFRKGTPASPLKLYEYMACSKPVVATDDPDNQFIVDQNAGILVDPESARQVADAIITLLRNDALREQMGRNGLKYVLEKRSWQAVAREIEETIKMAVSEY
jgi:glycosyltransferase involved in cell wall biosynthesis